MTRRRKRKSKLYEAIEYFDGIDLKDVPIERVGVLRDLMSAGYLCYDDDVPGMVIRPTVDGKEVLENE